MTNSHTTSNNTNNALATTSKGTTYLLAPDTKGRNFVSHGFTTQSLIRKRYNENTSTAAITLNLLLPYLNAFNARLEAHIKDGRDLSTEEALHHLVDCAGLAAVSYADVIARVSLQTAMACYLIEHPSPAGNATVYLWDAYPRMHRKYIGDVLEAIRLPKFLSSLLGVMPTQTDLAIYNTRAPFLNVFEDSVRRHILTTIADIIVTNARNGIVATIHKRAAYRQIAAQKEEDVTSGLLTEAEANELANQKKKQADAQHAIASQTVGITAMKVLGLVGRAVGAAAGNYADGGRGEYWGEMFGGIIAATYAASMLSAYVRKKTEVAVGASADAPIVENPAQ